jgi:hypothetical protein
MSATPDDMRLRRAAYERTRTRPPAEAPLLALFDRGPRRPRVFLMGYLERHGFHLFVTRKLGLIGKVVAPDIVILRIDGGAARLPSALRHLPTVRETLPGTGVIVMMRNGPTERELTAVAAVPGTVILRSGHGYNALLVTVRRVLSSQLAAAAAGHGSSQPARRPAVAPTLLP